VKRTGGPAILRRRTRGFPSHGYPWFGDGGGNPAVLKQTGPVAFRPTVTRGLAFETNLLLTITGNPAVLKQTGPVAFRPMVAHGLA
jgi:hypothetical protein